MSQLQSIGVGVVQYHPEAAPGQFEVALSPGKAQTCVSDCQLSEDLLHPYTQSACCGLYVTA